MNVLYTASLYRPHVGGIETMVEELGMRLQDEGANVTVLTKQWPDECELDERETINGIDIVRVPTATLPEEYERLAHVIGERKSEMPVDVVHSVGIWRPLPLFGVMLAREANAPVVGTFAGSEVPDPHDNSMDYVWERGKRYMRPILTQFDALNAVSQSVADNAQAVAPEIGKIDVLPVGINTEACEVAVAPERYAGVPYIVSTRRLFYAKGTDVLINAFSKIAAEWPACRLVIAGDGPERPTLEKLVSDLDLTDRVDFLGAVPLQESLNLMKGAAATVVASRSEGGGLVNSEANAVGTPLIASDVGGIREYTDENSAILIPPEDPEALARALSEVHRNHDLVRQMVQNGIRRARRQSWDTIYPTYRDLYVSYQGGQQRSFEPWDQESSNLWNIVSGLFR